MGFDKKSLAKTYAPQDGDTLQAIAERETSAGNRLSAEEIARFNWGTDDPDQIDEFLRDELGCYKRGPDKHFVISADAVVRTDLLIPVAFKKDGLGVDQTHNIRVKKQPPPPNQFQACAQIQGVTFDFDRSFVRPSVVGDLKAVETALQQHPNSKVMIFGHTDKVGSEDYNKSLSERRARSVFAFITNKPDVWEELHQQEGWGTREHQEMLADQGFDPGPIDGVNGPKTQAAVREFQTAQGLAVDGVVGPNTRKALFTAYMSGKHDILIEDGQFMDPKHMGCGEFNPQVETEAAEEKNRRVTFFLFNEARLPNLPCKNGDLAPCRVQVADQTARTKKEFRCSFYDSISRKCPCEVPQPVIVIEKIYNVTNVKTPTHIAPQTEKIKIECDIENNKNKSIDSGKVEILRKSDNKVLKNFPLSAAQLAAGHLVFEWSGTVDKNAEFPDGFVTLEHTDYQIKITASGEKGDKSGTADIKVELKDFKIALAPKDVLKKDLDKAVYDQIGTIPAASPVKVKLLSNLYTVDGAVDEKTTQASFTLYQTLWGGGPRVPLHATATVINSQGDEVPCGTAMGRGRVLWDFEDPAEAEPAYHATPLAPPPAVSKSKGAKPFVDKALNYDKAATRPKNGDNCHLDRGGKRVSSSGPPLFHGQDGLSQNFPFKVAKGATRFWGCFAEFQKTGDHDGRAGAIFRPSRMAGDNYKVTAYLDLKAEFDVTDDKPSGALKEVAVGEFEVWRLINLVEHFKKGSQVSGTMPTFSEYYQDAFVEVKDDRGAVKDWTKASYNALFTPAFTAASGNALVKKYGLAPGTAWDAQVPPTAAAANAFIAMFLTHTRFKNAVSAGEGKTGAALTSLLTSNGVETVQNYANRIQSLCISISQQMGRAVATKPGITVIQFAGTNNLEGQCTFPLNGLAISMTSAAKRDTSAFLLCQTNAQAAQTPAHEIGHLTFLPHSPRIDKANPPAVISTGGGITADFHDKENRNCLMSYARPRPGFCGLCLLRLRGWKGDEFDQNGPKTTK